jgi:hypothetical protein
MMRLQWKPQWTIPSAVGVVSFGVGVGVGCLFSSYRYKRLEKLVKKLENTTVKFESDVVQLQFKLDEDQEKMNGLFQQAGHVVKKFRDEGTNFLERQAEELRSMSVHPTASAQEPNNIFSGIEDDWNEEEEVKKRRPGVPYTIHRDEFFLNEPDHSQTTLQYYLADNVLCDTDDTPIYNHHKLVGELEFGRGSQDPNIVYVRNDDLKADFEVLLDHGYFQVEVLGGQLEDELNHEDFKHSVRKFREE